MRNVNKTSFVYYLEWADELLKLPEELRLKIDDAVKRYVLYGEEPTDRDVLYSMFGLMRRQIDRDVSRWNDIRLKRREAGAKGAAVTNQQKAANSANADKRRQSSANSAVNVDVDVNVDANVDVERENRQIAKRFVAPSLEEIRAYIHEKCFAMSAEAFYNHYEANGWMVGRNKMKSWKAAVAQWNGREPEFQAAPLSSGKAVSTPQSRAKETAGIVARLLAKDNEELYKTEQYG